MVLLLRVFSALSVARAQEPITFQYIYDDIGQLVKVVDSTGTVIEYVYDPAGNMLETKRSTVAGLAVFGFTPRQGAIGARVQIEGQAFSAVSEENDVAFNGTPAGVSSATSTVLVATVPKGATTGPISVTVGADTAISDTDFVVLHNPVVEDIEPKIALAGTTLPDLSVAGINLTGASFDFAPELAPPQLTIGSATVNPDGTSASLVVAIDALARGSFVLVATRFVDSEQPESSDRVAVAGNTLVVVDGAGDEDRDGLSNSGELANRTDPFKGDSDGDGFGDGDEVAFGSNPSDPASMPVNPYSSIGEAGSQAVSVLNSVNPCAPVDGVVPVQCDFSGEAESPAFSVLNTIDPCAPIEGATAAPCGITGEVESRLSSVNNLASATPTP